MPILAVRLRKGVRDLIRVSDGRMSGTAYGAVALHASPRRKLVAPLLWSKPETASGFRRAASQPDDPHSIRGSTKLYVDHVQQSHLGADLDFLVGKDIRPVTRESH